MSRILVVSTDSTTPVANGVNYKDEVLVATIGANQATKHEISNSLIRQMSLIVTDDVPTAKGDSGDPRLDAAFRRQNRQTVPRSPATCATKSANVVAKVGGDQALACSGQSPG